MKKRIPVLLSFALLTACSTKTTDPESVSNSKEKVEETFQGIALEANPTTGFDWNYSMSEEGIIELSMGYKQDANENGDDGVGGTDYFSISALKEGTVFVTFTYQQSWNPSEEDDTEIYAITVDSNLNYTISKAIALEANPTTGYDWNYSISEEGIIELNQEYIPDSTDEQIVGSGGTDYFTITTLKQGSVTVTFTYERSWAPSEDDEVITYTINVNSNLDCTIIKM